MKLKLPKDVLVVIVLFRSLKWTKVSISSFFDHFIGDMLVVDNNLSYHPQHWPYNECEWVTNRFDVEVIKNVNAKRFFSKTHGGTHGFGIDRAMDYAKNNGYKYILHIEPDCVFWDTVWFEEINERIREENLWTICNGINGDQSSAALWDIEKKIILHPPHICASMWKVNDTPNVSFQFKFSKPGDTEGREALEKFYDEKPLDGVNKDSLPKSDKLEFILDTGILRRIYYDSFGKGGHSTNLQGFAHFWLGSENFYYEGKKGNQNRDRLQAELMWWEREGMNVIHGSPYFTEEYWGEDKDEYIAHENLPIYKWKSSIIEKMRKYSPELVPPGY
jgi:hypothetical protein|tara:strand:- start:275 stop:1273 length:999 start_codon:yes stop_codon:yes gene_type:complete